MSCHVKMGFGASIIWFFLSQFSQSTGCNGCNACTFIALKLAKFYFLHKLNWINLFLLETTPMTVFTTRIGRYFSVQEVTIPFLGLITGIVKLEDFFDLSILNENPMVPHQSSL